MDNRKISELSSNSDINPPKNPLKSPAKTPPETETPSTAPKIKAEPKQVKVVSTPAQPIAAKPMVEGINAPTSSSEVIAVKRPDFTEQEKQLISETDRPQTFNKEPKARLMPESVVKRQGRAQTHFKAMFFTMIMLLLVIFAGYKLYAWELEKTAVQGTQNNYSPISNDNGQGSLGDSTTSTSTLSGLPAGSSASTSSSSISSMPFPLAGGTPPATGTPATTTPPAGQVLQLKITSTPTGYLNVRSEPSTSGQILEQVHPGEVYTYTSTQPGWYFISIPTATSGWVSAQYVTLQ